MSIRWFMGLGFVWIMSQLLCGLIEGTYVGEDEVEIINVITAYKMLESQGFIAIPALGWELFTNLPQLISFDYAVFEGSYSIIRLILVTVFGFGVIWGILQTFGPAMQGLLPAFLRFGR